MKNKAWLLSILVLTIINIFLFWPGNLYFLNDDLLHIPLTDRGQFFQTNSVRPIHELLVRIELLLWGKIAYGYHITALLLHLVVCFQLYELCLTMQTKWLKVPKQQAMKASFLAVCLFLIYPQSSESLSWILGRAPVLSAVFFMVAIRLFFVEKYTWLVYFAGAFFFAASLFSYEQTILLPVALIWITFLEKDKEKRSAMFKYVVVLFFVDLVYVVVRKLITAEIVGAYEGGNLLRMNIGTLAANAFRLLFRLVLNPEAKKAFILNSSVLVLLGCIITMLTRKIVSNSKAVIFFTGLIILLIAPVISLGLAVNSFESGRYLYLPSIFFIIGIGIAYFEISKKDNRLSIPLAVLLISISIYWLSGKYIASQNYRDASLYSKSVQQKIEQHFQRSSDTLYLDTLRVTVHRLPVFRRGFKTGVNWLNASADTNKIVVRYFHDEVLHRSLE